MKIAIVPYEPRWREGAAQVVREVLYNEYGYPPRPARDFDVDDLGAHYSPPESLLLVALDGERVVGTAATHGLSRAECEVRRMFILPEYRGAGLGAEMLTRLLDFAEKRGYERVLLDTAVQMTRALALYRRFGFVEIPRYNDNVNAEVFMEKRLGGHAEVGAANDADDAK
ncbi:MAG: GNAT family N-acetyltransferase [Chloroflexia bacterium]